jgi:enoyl-CoA hydratase/carnithine racemase
VNAASTVTVEDLPWGVRVLTLRSADGVNALDRGLVSALGRELEVVGSTPGIRAVILRGNDRYFSSGADARVIRDLLEGELRPAELDLPRKVFAVPVPTLACVEGNAIGGGLALALACDLLYVATEAKVTLNFVTFGLTPGMGTTALAALAFGQGRADEMLLTGRIVRGEELRSCPGMCAVEARDRLFGRVLDRASQLAGNPEAAVRLLKAGLVRRRIAAYEAAFVAERSMHEQALATPSLRESMEAFLRGASQER